MIGSRTEQIKDRIAQGTVTYARAVREARPVLADLRDLGTLAELNTSGDDIAEQIDSVKDKVTDAQAEEAELLDMQSRARTVAEQLEVKGRLEAVRKDIDALKSQRAEVRGPGRVQCGRRDDRRGRVRSPDDEPLLGRALDTGIGAALTILAGTLVLLGGLMPLALLGLGVWFVVRAARRRRTT